MYKLVSSEFLDIDHFRQQLRGWDTPAVQIEPGLLRLRLRSINLGGLVFSSIGLNRKVIDRSRIDAGWFNFVINQSPALFCGRELKAGQMTVLMPGRDYHSLVDHRWHSLEIAVSASVLAEEGLYLAPHLYNGPESASIGLSTRLVADFQRLAILAFGGNIGLISKTSLRRALLQTLDQALVAGGGDGRTTDRRHSINGYALTHKMLRYIESRPGQRITVAEIAGELEVTSRALNYAARSTLGISPLDMVLAFRLNQVREDLWAARSSKLNITSAAASQEFWHLGRFSRQYRMLFGELPSQTFHRIRQLAD